MRYKLWEFDVFINRAIVYSALTAFVVGTYILVVTLFGLLFQAQT